MNRRQLLRAILATPGFAIVPVEATPPGLWRDGPSNPCAGEFGDVTVNGVRFPGSTMPDSWFIADHGLTLFRA